LQIVEKFAKAINFSFFGKHLVDFFPILVHVPRSIPFVQFKKEAEVRTFNDIMCDVCTCSTIFQSLGAIREELLNRPFEYALSQEVRPQFSLDRSLPNKAHC
jgi:hypothetical protein